MPKKYGYDKKSKVSPIATRDTRQDAWKGDDPGKGSQNKVKGKETQERPAALKKVMPPGIANNPHPNKSA